MAIWIEEWSLLYSLCPRTASGSTADALLRNFGGVWLPAHDIVDKNGNFVVQKKHSTFNDILEHKLITESEFNKAHKLVTVRNPFDSIYSVWYKKKHTYPALLNHENSFVHRIPGFVDDINFIVNHTFSEWFIKKYKRAAENGRQASVNCEWTRHATDILRFERIQQEFSEFLKKLSTPKKFEIEPRNVTEGRRKNYREEYSAEARRIGEIVFERELNNFGYKF